jgi:hypothetical protein
MILAESLSTSAEIVAWICFGLGVLLVIGGVVLGLALSYPKTVVDIRKKVEHAKARVDELLATAVATAGESAPNPGAAASAGTQADAAKSTMEEITGILNALPEKLRFSGLLILVGTVLMSVATVQFGGHSIF